MCNTCLQSISLVLRHPVTKYKWMFSLKHTLPLVLTCHTHAQSPSLSLSAGLWHVINCGHYQRQLAQELGPSLGAWGPALQHTKKCRERNKEAKTPGEKGHIERVTEWWWRATQWKRERETWRERQRLEGVMRHTVRCNTLPKRDCGTVNNLSENIFLGPFHRPTNPPWALFRGGSQI